MTAALIPLLAIATSAGLRVTKPVVAQARLADAIIDADSIDWVRADRAHHAITIRIDRAGEAYELVATTSSDGAIVALEIRDAGPGSFAIGRLSWLIDELRDVEAVARLDVDDRGDVTLVTRDDRHYAIVPGRGDGNDAVRARWAAAWS
jgi:hypothetical protein